MVEVALDAMSGDRGLGVAVEAAVAALAAAPELRLILVGDEAALRAELKRHKAGEGPRLSLRHATEVVGMDEGVEVLRSKKDSSMRVAINLVKEGAAQAAVSAGNTGVLMATARFVLKTLPGIDRPAIITAIPTVHGHTHMLDLGANVECSPQNLFQFAVMGSVVAEAVNGLERPRVGLLNIGEEEQKGNDEIREAAALIQRCNLINYIGFIEGDDIFLGDVDVVVCDGFVGNVALKTSEGLAKLIKTFMQEEFSRNALTRLSALAAMPVLKAFGRRIDPRRYNGASLIGLKGVVIKSHGGADAMALASAINVALLEVEKRVPERISHLLEGMLAQGGDAGEAQARAAG